MTRALPAMAGRLFGHGGERRLLEGCRVLGFRVWGFGFLGSGFGLGFRVFWVRALVWGLGFGV